MGLPKVREGTYDSVTESIKDYEDDFDFILKYMDHIHISNPIVLAMMMQITKKMKGIRYATTLAAMCLLYKLLDSEAEAIDFEKEMEASNANCD